MKKKLAVTNCIVAIALVAMAAEYCSADFALSQFAQTPEEV